MDRRKVAAILALACALVAVAVFVPARDEGEPPAAVGGGAESEPLPEDASAPVPAGAEPDVAGVVLGTDGEPAAGVPVLLRGGGGPEIPRAAMPSLLRMRSAIGELEGAAFCDTGPDGRFAAACGADGPFAVLALGGDRGIACLSGVPKGSRDLVVRLEAVGRVRGRVVDETGAPVSGALVGPEWFAEVSGADGGFLLTGLPPGAGVRVPVGAEGYERSELRAVPRAGEEIVLPDPVVLRRVPGISGRVLAPDGTPARWTLVRLHSGETYPRSRRTDTAGRYAYDGELPPRWRITVHAKGCPVAEATRTRREGERRVEMPDIRLAAGGSIAGRVLSPDGAPVPGARILAIRVAPGGTASFVGLDESAGEEVRTAEDGTFTMTGLAPGALRVLAFAPGFAPAGRSGVHPSTEAGGGPEIELVLGPEVAVSGLVVNAEGDPVRALVRVFTPPSTLDEYVLSRIAPPVHSDLAGRFRLPLFGEGPVAVTAMAVGYEGAEVRDVTPATGNLVIRLGTAWSGSIAGRVVDAGSGLPIAGAFVDAEQVLRTEAGEGWGIYGQVKTDADGRFRLENVQAGLRRLHVHGAEGYAQARVEGIEVRPGAETADVVLRLSRGGSVAGVVRDREGRPLAGARLTLVPFRTGVYTLSARSDGSGAYSFEHVPAGRHVVVLAVAAPGGAPPRRRVTEVEVAEGEETRADLEEPAAGD